MKICDTLLRSVCLLILFTGFVSCSGSKSVFEDTGSSAELVKHEAQLIFLNYSIKKKADNSYQLELINQIVTAGTRKQPASHPHEQVESDLSCLILDKDKRPLSTQAIPDPFTKRVEFLQEDGSYSTREISLDSTVISIRMPLESASRYVAVRQSGSGGGPYLIMTEID